MAKLSQILRYFYKARIDISEINFIVRKARFYSLLCARQFHETLLISFDE